MSKKLKVTTTCLAMTVLAASSGIALAGDDDAGYCMDVVIEPFHMMPDMQPEGTCTVRDYWGGELQDAYYPFTKEEHLFNCEYFGPISPLPTGDMVPSAVVSDGNIVGTIGGHAFEAKLACASLTNWYQDSCAHPDDPSSCSFQLAQPFLNPLFKELGLDYYPRVTEVSIFDGVITVDNGRRTQEVPIVMATRAAGITHLEDVAAPLVGASITHSLLGMVTYRADDEDEYDRAELGGSADLLLQGHIFFPGSVEDDVDEDGNNKAAVIKGSICSEDLYKQLNRKGGGHGYDHGHGGGHRGGKHHDDD
ncbi:MAG: hypothetical protein WBO73_03475 [Gammaproteobacteria bacterium]